MAKEPEKSPVRDLVPTGIMTEFGELLDDPTESASMGGQKLDLVYTPGFSEMRWARDKALAEVAQGKRARTEVPTLPVNVRLVRRSNMAGKPDMQKQISSSNRGYRAVNKDDVGQPWFTRLPDGAEVLADGSVVKGDTAYMVCSKEKAARNRYENDRKTIQRLTGASERAETAGVSYESRNLAPLRGAPPSKINVT